MVKLTPKAAERVRATLAREGRPGGCLRLRVSAGGCSGMSYAFEFVDAPQPGDTVSEQDGARLAVDPKAFLFVNGSEVDWHQTLMESGFRVRNPNAVHTCNCGTSFSAF